ncbi:MULTISPECIES: 3-hydroxyacyl-CoA dehydrogenase [unclassified Streptomyces]|uniref:3-hydroxyacyl-CoA dehydrogenase n=1 Tax=unclassified Streptomyces TaxID=2593676 RepID=UPI00081DD219|nr:MULTISPECIES: 3-hydroxyacyl-CoA dehydrogenase [unclassified Streptomyces]MYZ36999.1 3-hydroxyacyl-CoA dehydrogenase [Streptomyces sp. SID4917]SCF87864.1 3-hydroxyacyl-CoA dehydrogenase [Streptomyces sp. MnatMP-M17]
MTAIEPGRVVAVVGTGTMGQGIAQVALVAGHPVRLYDAVPGRAEQAAASLTGRLDRLAEKGRLDASARDAAVARLRPAAELTELADAALVVEAVLEQLSVKRELFAALEDIVGDDCLLATNTSSLSVTAVAGGLRLPGRLVGLHFFNPAPLLPLVEVVSGFATDERAARCAFETARAWGKTPVRCADTPGFIVNRVARPYYAEAFRIYEERAADPATIDAVLRESGGFRMGPFELTDLIGQDVNEAVTRSVWESFFQDVRFTPSLAQRRLVESGRLGRKSGQGWFPYGEGATPGAGARTEGPAPAPASVTVQGGLLAADTLPGLIEEAGIEVLRKEDAVPGYPGWIELSGGTRLFLADGSAADDAGMPVIHFDLALDYRAATRIALAPAAGVDRAALNEAVGLFQALGKDVSVIADVPGMIVARTVAMLVDFALDAAARGVASSDDIDTAMRLGVNYPRGPLDWGAELGARWVLETLESLHEEYPIGRYAPSQALRRLAAAQEEDDAS